MNLKWNRRNIIIALAFCAVNLCVLLFGGWALQQSVTILGSLPSGSNVIGGVTQSGTWTVTATSDPCTTQIKSKAFAHITTATTTALVPVSGSTSVFVCGIAMTMVGTIAADTVKLVQGTGASCAGSPSDISATFNSGVLTAGAMTLAYGSGEATITSAASGNGVCAVSIVGTGPSIDIMISYVQQ